MSGRSDPAPGTALAHASWQVGIPISASEVGARKRVNGLNERRDQSTANVANVPSTTSAARAVQDGPNSRPSAVGHTVRTVAPDAEKTTTLRAARAERLCGSVVRNADQMHPATPATTASMSGGKTSLTVRNSLVFAAARCATGKAA